MRRVLSASILCLALVAAARVHAQAPSRDIADLARHPVRVFTTADGLPQSSIETMAVDWRGYLWVGTRDGAAFWNGRNWTVVRMPDHRRSNWVRAILAASDGSLWFATGGGGLHRLADTEWTTFDAPGGLPSTDVRALLETRDADHGPVIWVGTRGGVARFTHGTWEPVGPPPVSGEWLVSSLAETIGDSGARTIWAGAQNAGLWRFTDNRWTPVPVHSDPDAAVQGLWTDPSTPNQLWVIVEGTLTQLTDARGEPTATRMTGLPAGPVFAMTNVTDSGGARRPCVATGAGIIGCYDGTRWREIVSSAALPSRFVFGLQPILVGNVTRALWIGTQEGLARLELGGWLAFDRSNGLPAESVASLLISEGGSRGPTLWIGTLGGGLARLNDGRWTYYDHSSGLPDDNVLALLETRDANERPTLWVGTNRGLAQLQDGRLQTAATTDSGLPHNAVVSLLATRDPSGEERIWAGTYGGGLARFGRDGWKTFDRSSGLPDNRIEALLATESQARGQEIWAATNAGLAVLRGASWHVFDSRDGLPNHVVRSLHLSVDRSGRRTLWAGTGGGIAWRDLEDESGGWQSLTDETTPALPNAVVYRIEEDAGSRLYLCTGRGVVRLTRRQPTLQPGDISITTFTREDGLPSIECNFGASATDAQRRIWVGTTRGAAVFDPTREVADTSVKPLRLVNVLAGEEVIAAARFAGMRFPHHRNRFVFDVALVSLFREAETRYRVQLLGFDPHPGPWEADGRATYTNVPAGDYVFRAWARDYAGNLSGPLDVRFRVAPAPWNTWWARSAGAAFLGLLIYGAFRVRIRALRQRTRQLEDMVSARTVALEQKAEEAAASERTAQEAHARLRDAQEKIEGLLKAAPDPAGDLDTWCRMQARALAGSLGVSRVEVWLMEAGQLRPLSETSGSLPDVRDLQRSAQDRSWLETPDGTMVPLLATSGALVGGILLSSEARGLGEAEARVVASFARHLGAAIELHQTRLYLDEARDRRLAARAELSQQGVELLQICPRCGVCYGEDTALCRRDGSTLSGEHAFPLRIAGRYRLERVLGRGGLGIVFAAYDFDLDRRVAVKLLTREHRGARGPGRLEHEAWAVTRVQHPGVVALYDAGALADGSHYLVMERLSGHDLAATLSVQGPGRFRQVAALVEQGASALAAAHREGLLHRDIKPSNVFLMASDDADGFRVKVLDFGIAQAAAPSIDASSSSSLVGTPAYMSPEQIRGEPLDARSDLYAFAAVCYEALTGRRTIRADRLPEMMLELATVAPSRASQVRPEVPADVDKALAYALAKRREDRPSSITAWADRLAAALRACRPSVEVPGWDLRHAQESIQLSALLPTSTASTRRYVMPDPGTSVPELRWSVPVGVAEGYYVNSVSISNDGRTVVAGTFKHTYGTAGPQPASQGSDDSGTFGTYCYDADGTQRWQDTFQGNEGIYATAVSGDGTIAASGGWFQKGQALLRAYRVSGDGTPLFSYTPSGRVNAVALSNDGSVLVAGADAVYLFQQSDGVFPASPAVMSLMDGTTGAQSIAVTDDGDVLVTADTAKDGSGHDVSTVYRVENSGGTIGTKQTCLLHDTIVHAVAMTPDGAWFAASATDMSTGSEMGVLYVFTPASIAKGVYQDKLELQGLPPAHTVGAARGVAISGDGSRIAVVANDGSSVGIISLVSNDAGTLAQQWTKVTPHSPNSTSLDAAGKYVTIANGYPDGKPGQFVLCDAATGDMLWTYPTDNMNWPMVLSADGSAIAAGSDNGTVYYFTPTADGVGV